MLDGMSLTGIDITQIATNLVGAKIGDTSTSMPGPGWLRVDALGKLWVYDGAGEAAVYRGNWGGWETRRYRTGNYIDTFTTYPQLMGYHRGLLHVQPNNDSGASNVFVRGKSGAVADTHAIKLLESTSSGDAGRILMRGGAVAVTGVVAGVYTPGYIGTYQANGTTNYPLQVFPAGNLSFGCRNRGLSLGWTRARFFYWAFGANLAAQ